MGPRRRRLLHQSRPSRVARATASTLRQGPPRWSTAALWRRLRVLARALSRGSGFAGPRTGSAVPEAANRRLEARRGAPLGVLDQKVRHTAIPMMNQAAAPDRPALVPGLLQRIQHNAGVSRAAGTPADKTPRQTSMTKATQTKPAQVATEVKSDSHKAFGRGALNGRLTRSSGHGAAALLIVVRTGLPRPMPRRH